MLEIGIVKSQNYDRINTFTDNLDIQKLKTAEKLERKKVEAEMQKTFDKTQALEDRKLIIMEKIKLRNDRKLLAVVKDTKVRLSKRA